MKRLSPTYIAVTHTFGSFINITSEEQFVPLFLIFMNQKRYGAARYSPDGREAFYTEGTLPVQPGPEDKNEFKDYYLKEMEKWGIKRYSLYLNTDDYGQPTTSNGTSSIVDPKYPLDIVVEYDQRNGLVVAPYYIGSINRLQYTTVTSHEAPSKSMVFPILRNTFLKSNFLIVVKAKHLKYLRTCFLFDAKADIPFSDIKCLRIPVMSSAVDQFFLSVIRPLVSQLDMTVEFTSSDEINKYLFGPIPSYSKEQIIARAVSHYEKTVTSFRPIVFE